MDIRQWIGFHCKLLSKQGIRYTGTLCHIDPAAGRIQVTNVRSYGTEDRPAQVFIPPIDQPFPLIEFHVNDLSDLQFDQNVPAATPASLPSSITQPSSHPVPQNPQPAPPRQPQSSSYNAGLSADKAVPAGYQPHPVTQAPPAAPAPAPAPVPQPQAQPTHVAQQSYADAGGQAGRGAPGRDSQPRGTRGGRGRGRGRGGHVNGNGAPTPRPVTVPNTDFDFQSSNQRFDKSAAAKQPTPVTEDATTPINDTATPATNGANGPVESKTNSYNPTKSFFDNLSSDAAKPTNTERGGYRGRGRGGGKSRRDEERDKNVETFGEPGGIGLLGPGQYVGGYGGYRGRRRRGGPRVSGPGRGGGARATEIQT